MLGAKLPLASALPFVALLAAIAVAHGAHRRVLHLPRVELRRAPDARRRPAVAARLPEGCAVRVDAAAVAAVAGHDGRAARRLQRVGSVGPGPRGAGAPRLAARGG